MLLAGKSNAKEPVGKSELMWKDNIKMVTREIVYKGVNRRLARREISGCTKLDEYLCRNWIYFEYISVEVFAFASISSEVAISKLSVINDILIGLVSLAPGAYLCAPARNE